MELGSLYIYIYLHYADVSKDSKGVALLFDINYSYLIKKKLKRVILL